jgi:hypothetical protein
MPVKSLNALFLGKMFLIYFGKPHPDIRLTMSFTDCMRCGASATNSSSLRGRSRFLFNQHGPHATGKRELVEKRITLGMYT